MKPCKQTLSLQLHLVHYRSMAVVDLTMLELGEKCCKLSQSLGLFLASFYFRCVWCFVVRTNTNAAHETKQLLSLKNKRNATFVFGVPVLISWVRSLHFSSFSFPLYWISKQVRHLSAPQYDIFRFYLSLKVFTFNWLVHLSLGGISRIFFWFFVLFSVVIETFGGLCRYD